MSQGQPASIAHLNAAAIHRSPANQEHAEDHYATGQEHYAAGRYRQAARSFERARQTPGLPDNVMADLLYNLAVSNLNLERWATAIMYLEEYLSMPGADRETAEAHLELAKEGTASDFESISERIGLPPTEDSDDPGSDGGRAKQVFHAGLAQYDAGRFRQAIILFENARQLPTDQEGVEHAALYNIGRANLRLRRFSTAIIYFEQARDVAATDEQRADIDELLNEARESSGALTGEDQAKMMHQLADEAYDARDFKLAAQRFQDLLAIRGIEEKVRQATWYNLAFSYFRLGRTDQARRYLDHYLAASPDSEQGLELQRRINGEDDSESESAN